MLLRYPGSREGRDLYSAALSLEGDGLTEQDEDENERDDEPDLDEDAIEEEEDLDDEIEEDLDDPDLGETAIDIVNLDAAVDVADDAEPAAPPATATPAPTARAEEEEVVVELDDELHPDDVEEPLDVLLKERTAAATLEDDEEEVEEEEVDTDERGDGPAKILPRRPGEFLCTSCFLVLPRNQLADRKRMLCRDCA